MNKQHRQRIYYLIFATFMIAIATSLILYALKNNINAFMTPSDVRSATLPPDYQFHLGGMVKPKSLVHQDQSLTVHFIVTDLNQELPVIYTGILPDLFREGKGVIAKGHLNAQGSFVANEVLAKHDENYSPARFIKGRGKHKA